MAEKRKPPAAATASAKCETRLPPGTMAGLCGALAALAVAFMFWQYGGAHDEGAVGDVLGVTLAPSYSDSDEQGQLDVYNHSSFAPMWELRSDATDSCWRTDDFHGVPFSVEMADQEELDMDALAPPASAAAARTSRPPWCAPPRPASRGTCAPPRPLRPPVAGARPPPPPARRG